MRKRFMLAAIVMMSILCMTACTKESSTESTKESTKKSSKETAKEDEKAWMPDDFSLYDQDGELYDYPDDTCLRLYHDKEEDKKYQLKRGVKLFDHAKVALSKYDLSGFYRSGDCYPKMGCMTEEENKIAEKYLAKYPDVNDAVKHTSELRPYKLGLFISCRFKKEDGKLIRFELNEKGFPVDSNYEEYETYYIYFRINDDKIIGIGVANSLP